MSEVKIGNPAPLGLSGFALTTFILSLFNAGFLDASHNGIVIGLAVAYGGIAQFAAGMWEFRTGNTFGATAFTSFGAFWVSFALLQIGTGLVKGVNVPDAGAVGWYLVGWGIFTGIMALGSFRTDLITAGVFVLLFATFIVLGLGALQGNSNIGHLGGYLGLATAAVAGYRALAHILASFNNGKNVLPVFPLTS
jgi:succinate-acetate transporter protein